MLAQLSSQKTSAPPVATSSGSATQAATRASATTTSTPSDGSAGPGVITHISPAARAAAATEPTNLPQTSSTSNVILDCMSEAQARAMKIGGQAMTTLRPALKTTVGIALDMAYVTELFLGNAIGTTKYFSKEEYVEKYDIGAVLGYIRDYVNEAAAAEESSAAGPQDVNAVAPDTRNKIERWVDRLRGPKVEVLEHIAVGAAVGYALARIARIQR